MKALRVIGYVCLSLVSAYSVVFSDSKNFQWLVVVCWAGVFYHWWLEDRDARKDGGPTQSYLSANLVVDKAHSK